MGYMQIWFIGRTLASQAGKAGSTPVICCLKPLILLGSLVLGSLVLGNRKVIKHMFCYFFDVSELLEYCLRFLVYVQLYAHSCDNVVLYIRY